MLTYGQMLADNEAAAPIYQGGKFWQEINRQFSVLIWAGALQTLRDEYFNRRFAGADPNSRQVYRCLLWLYYNHLKALDRDGFLKRVAESPVGGTLDQETIDGREMSIDFLQSVDEAFRLREAWSAAGRPGEPRVIVELGAGYGRLAYVARKLFPECTYVILDLPGALICAQSWLSRALPGEVVPYEESRQVTRFTRELLQSRKVWTLGAHQFPLIEAGAIDAFVNIYSMQEMTPPIIEHYFAQIERTVTGVLFLKERNLERNVVDDVQVSHDTYPFRSHWKKLFWQPVAIYEDNFEAAFSLGPS